MAKILVAGSDPVETNTRALLVEFAGYQCETAESLDEALRILTDGLIDVTIADTSICGSNPEALMLFKEAAPQTRLLLLSETAEKAPGADHVLALPCTPEDLFEAIQSLTGERSSYAAHLPQSWRPTLETLAKRKPA